MSARGCANRCEEVQTVPGMAHAMPSSLVYGSKQLLRSCCMARDALGSSRSCRERIIGWAETRPFSGRTDRPPCHRPSRCHHVLRPLRIRMCASLFFRRTGVRADGTANSQAVSHAIELNHVDS